MLKFKYTVIKNYPFIDFALDKILHTYERKLNKILIPGSL